MRPGSSSFLCQRGPKRFGDAGQIGLWDSALLPISAKSAQLQQVGLAARRGVGRVSPHLGGFLTPRRCRLLTVDSGEETFSSKNAKLPRPNRALPRGHKKAAREL